MVYFRTTARETQHRAKTEIYVIEDKLKRNASAQLISLKIIY